MSYTLADLTAGPRLFSLKTPTRGFEFLLVVDNHAHRITTPKTDTGIKEAWRGTPLTFFLMDETLAYLDSSSDAMGPVALRRADDARPSTWCNLELVEHDAATLGELTWRAPNRQTHVFDFGGYQFTGNLPELTATEA